MNSIEELKKHIRLKYPDAAIGMTAPLRPDGVWSLDVDLAGASLAIEWSPATGFGVSTTSNECFAEGPDEVFESLDRAQRRICQLLATKERTVPSIGRLLSRLRENRGLTQQDLANRL